LRNAEKQGLPDSVETETQDNVETGILKDRDRFHL
jgi:hypothetical protein